MKKQKRKKKKWGGGNYSRKKGRIEGRMRSINMEMKIGGRRGEGEAEKLID